MTVFQTEAYRAAYARSFGRGKRFLTVDVPGGDVWLQMRGGALKRLEWWAQGIADCGGVRLDSPEDAPKVWLEIERIAREGQGAFLAQLSADSPLVPLARQSGWRIEEAEVCPAVALPSSFDEYVSSLGKNMREQLRRYPKRLAKEFEVEYERAQTESGVEEFLTELFELHGKRWRKRGQPGVLALGSRQRFHRSVCREFLSQDWLRLWRLRCDGGTVCVLLFYFWGGKYWFFIGGFEPEMSRWSVGNCLFARVLQEAIAEGATEFDFLRGAEDYKYRFGATDRHFVNLSWFAPTSRGRLLQKRIELEKNFVRRIHQRFSAAAKH